VRIPMATGPDAPYIPASERRVDWRDPVALDLWTRDIIAERKARELMCSLGITVREGYPR